MVTQTLFIDDGLHQTRADFEILEHRLLTQR